MSEQQIFIDMSPGEALTFGHNRGTREVSVSAYAFGHPAELTYEVLDENNVMVTAQDRVDHLVFRWPTPDLPPATEPIGG